MIIYVCRGFQHGGFVSHGLHELTIKLSDWLKQAAEFTFNPLHVEAHLSKATHGFYLI